MKKILLFLSFLLMSIGVWGDDITYTFNTLSWGTTTTNWSNGKSGNSYQSGQGIQVTTGKTGANGTSPISFSNISSVVVTYCTNNKDGAGNIKVQIGNGTEKSFSVTKPSSGGTSLKTATFNFSPNETGKVKITVNCTSNSIYIYSCAITYGSSITHTVKFLNCDTIYGQRTEIAEGTKISGFPTDLEICEDCEKNGWKFFGWTKNGIDTLQSLKVEKNDTLYALYRISDIGTSYVTDTLTVNDFTATGSQYSFFSNVTKKSTAVYSGYTSAKEQGDRKIQINKNPVSGTGVHPGIISTISGGYLSEVCIKWNSDNVNKVQIHTSDTSFKSTDDLWNNGVQGEYILLDNDNPCTSSISGNYIGIRAYQGTGVVYIDTIFIRWTLGEVPVYSLCPKCYDAGVSVAHWYTDAIKFDIEDIGDSAQVILSSTKDTIYQKVRQDDWSYKFDKVGLNNLKCTNLKLTTFKSNDTTCIRRYQIPIMISETTNTLCDSCDVVVLSEGQLNIDKDTVSGDVTIYEGGRLKINADKNYSINSLTLRRENDSVPHLLNNGNITLAGDSNYFFEIRTDAADWRWSTLPSSHKVSDIKQYNGKPIALNSVNSEVYIKRYDGNARAVNHKNGWDYVKADSVLTSGQGFLFGVDLEGNRMKIYRFTFPNDSINKEKTSKTITGLRAWGCNDPYLAPNHKGWNLIGNPFADNDTTDIIDPIKTGELVKDTTVTPWNGKWVYRKGSEANLRYAVIPITWREWTADEAAAGGYASELLDDYVLPPFTSFFVQIGGDASAIKTLTFKPVGANPINRIVARAPQYDEDEELFLRVKVGDRKTGCFISNKFTDEYEPGDDLESRYPIYQSIGGYKLLYSAINDSIIEHGVQVTSPQGTLYLDPKVDVNKFEYIYANYNNNWYDLKSETVEVNGNFIIQAKRKIKDIPTDIEMLMKVNNIEKFIYNNNMYIKKHDHIYNVLGNQIR